MAGFKFSAFWKAQLISPLLCWHVLSGLSVCWQELYSFTFSKPKKYRRCQVGLQDLPGHMWPGVKGWEAKLVGINVRLSRQSRDGLGKIVHVFSLAAGWLQASARFHSPLVWGKLRKLFVLFHQIRVAQMLLLITLLCVDVFIFVPKVPSRALAKVTISLFLHNGVNSNSFVWSHAL